MMRLAKITNSLLLLALPAAFAVGAAAQEHPNVQPSQVKNQLAQAAPSGPAQAQSQAGKPSQPPAAPAKSPSPARSPVKPPAPANANPQGATKAPMKSSAPAKTTTPASKTGTKQPPVKTEAKAPQKAPEKAPQKTPEKAPSKAPVAAENKPPAKAPAKTEAKAKQKKPVEGPIELAHVARRDPFESLLAKQQTAGGTAPANLPQGKPGLIVGTLRVDGIVKSSNGMIAIVSNPQQRVYFLRDGDKLYDGSVEHITLEGISFHEEGKDAFGKPIEREVTKLLYPSSGEQQ